MVNFIGNIFIQCMRWPNLRRGLLIILLLAAGSKRISAAGVSAAFDRLFIELGETVQYTITVDDVQQIDPIQLPQIANLASGQDFGVSQQTLIINGAASSHVSHTYRFQPAAAGDFTVPSFKIRAEGKEYTTPPVRCRVTPAVGHTNGIWLKIVTERDSYALGEVIPLELQLFSAYNLAGASPPNLSLDGFIKGREEKPEQSQSVIDGKRHIVVTFRMTATATRGGDLTLGPASMELAISRGGLADFFGGNERKYTATTPGKVLHIIEPPLEGRPLDYTGAVGRFAAKATVSRTNFMAGDAVTLKTVVTGQGSFETLPAPKLVEQPGIKIYAGTNSFTASDSLGIIGTKTFEQAVIVEDPSVKELKFEPFSFFDPQSRRYDTVTLPPIPIRVSPAAGATAPVAQNGSATPATPDTKASSPDGLRPLRVDIGPSASLKPTFANSAWFALVAASPLALYAAASAGLRVLARQRRAAKPAASGLVSRDVLLSKLSNAANAGDAGSYYNTLNQLLQVEIAPVVGLPPNSVTTEIIESKLLPMGLPTEAGNRLKKLFEGVDEARFGGIAKPDTLRAAMAEVEPALNALRQLQWRN